MKTMRAFVESRSRKVLRATSHHLQDLFLTPTEVTEIPRKAILRKALRKARTSLVATVVVKTLPALRHSISDPYRRASVLSCPETPSASAAASCMNVRVTRRDAGEIGGPAIGCCCIADNPDSGLSSASFHVRSRVHCRYSAALVVPWSSSSVLLSGTDVGPWDSGQPVTATLQRL